MTLGKVLSLSDSLLLLTKRNFCWAEKAQNQEWLVIYQTPCLSLFHHKTSGTSLRPLRAKGLSAFYIARSPLWKSGLPSSQSVKWVKFEFFELHPTSSQVWLSDALAEFWMP